MPPCSAELKAIQYEMPLPIPSWLLEALLFRINCRRCLLLPSSSPLRGVVFDDEQSFCVTQGKRPNGFPESSVNVGKILLLLLYGSLILVGQSLHKKVTRLHKQKNPPKLERVERSPWPRPAGSPSAEDRLHLPTPPVCCLRLAC